MICPIAYLLFKIPSFFVNPEIYFLAFIPYIALSMSVFYVVLGTRNYKLKDLFLGQLLGLAAFSVYIRGAVSALLGVKVTFGVTEKVKGKALPYLKLWPQLTMLFVNFIAFVWGMNRFIYEREPAIAVNGFWALYHFMALCGIFYFNEENLNKKIFGYLPKKVKVDYRILETAEERKDSEIRAWKYGVTLFLPEYLKENTRLMCKLNPGDNNLIIFEAVVLWSYAHKRLRGFKTSLGLTAITDKDKERLHQGIIRL